MASGKKFLSYAGRALILLMLVLSSSSEISATGLLPTGSSKAIDFSLENILDGKSVTLSKSCDKVIVLEFGSRYFKPCLEMVPDLVKLYDNYKASGLMVFKIDIGPRPRPGDARRPACLRAGSTPASSAGPAAGASA